MKLKRIIIPVFLLAVAAVALAISTAPAFAICPASLGMVIDPNGNELMHWTGQTRVLPSSNGPARSVHWYLFEGQVYDQDCRCEVTHQLWVECD
ncbi:MAG: hypothetical protein ACLQMO_05780 [Acidobacteriaceae bacterium]